MANFSDFMDAFKKREDDKSSPFAVVTLAKIVGSAPQVLGARLITDKNGLVFGTVGGGKIEAYCLNKVKEKIELNELDTFTISVNLQRDIGMTCGGEVVFLIEFYNGDSLLNFQVFGAGHISQELVPLLLKLNSSVTVYDHRKEWLEKFKPQSRLSLIETNDMPSFIKTIPEKSHVIMVTMGHALDVPILIETLKRSDWSYLGVVGSVQKKNSLIKNLRENGVAEDKYKNFKCPMGLDIGNNEPFQIAISIVAEILSKDEHSPVK